MGILISVAVSFAVTVITVLVVRFIDRKNRSIDKIKKINYNVKGRDSSLKFF